MNAVSSLDVAIRLFDAIERGESDVVESLWAADVTVWHSGDEAANDRIRALKVIRWFIRTTTTRSYEILDREFFDGGFVQQHVLRADGTNGASITLRVCIVVKINADGLDRQDRRILRPGRHGPAAGLMTGAQSLTEPRLSGLRLRPSSTRVRMPSFR